MEIVNIKNENIEACFKFNYEGYRISGSTISHSSDVLIFNHEGNCVFQTGTVQEAIDWIRVSESSH